jgi:formate hydrogenlyase subunit 4
VSPAAPPLPPSPELPALAALAVLLVMAPALPGIAVKTKAVLTGRRGAPVMQLYSDLWKLLRKGSVISPTTTWLFRAGPVAVIASSVAAALLLPLDGRSALLSFAGDLVAFAGLLALGRFALVLAGLDTGSSFEGMGASREVTFAAFAEPALLLCFAALALATGDLTLCGMLGAPLQAAWPRAAAPLALVGISLFVLLLAECSRGPVDDPATHLELTMIHEVIVLDHGGPDFALVLFGDALKLALFGALVVGVFAPRAGLGAAATIAVLAAGLAAVAVAVGVVESIMARLRLSRVPQLLVGASALALFGILLLVSAG